MDSPGLMARCNVRAGHYMLILAAGGLLFLNNLGGPTLWDLDEGRNATAALEMMESGNFIVPTFNAQLRVDKPPLLYWLQILGYQLFGVNEFAARLPSALAALGTLLLCYELGRLLFSPVTALLGALILGSTGMMMGAAHFANPDSLLNFFVAFTLLVFWRDHAQPHGSWFILMGVLLGLGTLTKGPVAVLLPAFVVLIYLLWEKRLILFWDRRWWWCLAALALVALPWYIWVAVDTRGSFLHGFLWQHNVSRFLSPMDKHTGSILYYVLVLFVGMTPWSVLLPLAAWYCGWSMVRTPWPRGAAWWHKASENAGPNAAPASAAAYRFLGAWFGGYLVFFTLAATKLPNYVLPAAVPAALFTARFLDRWRLGEIQPRRGLMIAGLAAMAGLGVAAAGVMTVMSGIVPLKHFAGPIVHGLEHAAVVGLVPVVAALAGYYCLRRHYPEGVVLSYVLGAIFFMAPLAAWAMPAWNTVKAPRTLVNQTCATRHGEDIRIGGYFMEHLPSLNFYGHREVLHHTEEAEVLAFLHYQVPVYLFLPARRWEGLKARAPATCRLIAHNPDMYSFNVANFGEIVVVTNR